MWLINNLFCGIFWHKKGTRKRWYYAKDPKDDGWLYLCERCGQELSEHNKPII